MPLGYGNGVFPGPGFRSQSLQPSAKRPHQWAFAGNAFKLDRPEMIGVFQKLHSRPTLDSSFPNPEAMRRLYESAVFVPIGHGWVGTDCFRIYESAACGAIPVIALDSKHRNYTHGRVGRWEHETVSLPPWIFVSKWSEAESAVRQLLAKPQELLKRQQQVIAWWEAAWERTVDVLFGFQ